MTQLKQGIKLGTNVVEGKTKKLTDCSLTMEIVHSGEPEGKNISDTDGYVLIETKNVLTANDAAKKSDANVAEEKTQQNCEIMRHLDAHHVPVAFVSQINGTSFISKKCEMLPYECVIRRRATGSFLKRNVQMKEGFKFGGEFQGTKGLPIFEFFYKPAFVVSPEVGLGSRFMSEDEARKKYMVDGRWITEVYTDPYALFSWSEWRLNGADPDNAEGFKLDIYKPKTPPNSSSKLDTIPSLVTPKEYLYMVDIMGQCFMLLEECWEDFDVELIDMKIEFGKTVEDGELVIADVIDNDSWRIWPQGDSSKQLDKQSFRDGEELNTVEEKYRTVTEYVGKFEIKKNRIFESKSKS